MSPETAAYPITRVEVVSIGRTLPPAPRIMAQLRDVLNDVDTDIGDIARHVRSDPALMTRVIRMSNSAMFGFSEEGADIESALARVGFANVLSVVGAAGVKQMPAGALVLYGIDVDRFQECSLCHALAAEAVASWIGEEPQAAYIAALLRGVGMIVLDRASEPWLSPELAFSVDRDESYAAYERRMFGITSADATRMLMDEWGFPEPIVSAVDLHHLSQPNAAEHRLACVLNVSGEISAAAGYGLPGDEAHWQAAPRKYDVLGIDHRVWESLCTTATRRFADACGALQLG